MAAKLQSKTVTPTEAGLTVLPDAGFDGLSDVVINGDSDLKAANIKSGVNIFGVAGSYVGANVRIKAFSGTTSSTAGRIKVTGIGFEPKIVVGARAGTSSPFCIFYGINTGDVTDSWAIYTSNSNSSLRSETGAFTPSSDGFTFASTGSSSFSNGMAVEGYCITW